METSAKARRITITTQDVKQVLNNMPEKQAKHNHKRESSFVNPHPLCEVELYIIGPGKTFNKKVMMTAKVAEESKKDTTSSVWWVSTPSQSGRVHPTYGKPIGEVIDNAKGIWECTGKPKTLVQ